MKFNPDGAFALARSVVLDRLSRAELSDASRSILVGASVTESILPIICPCVSDTTISFTRAVGRLGGWVVTMTPDRVATWTRPDESRNWTGSPSDRVPGLNREFDRRPVGGMLPMLC